MLVRVCLYVSCWVHCSEHTPRNAAPVGILQMSLRRRMLAICGPKTCETLSPDDVFRMPLNPALRVEA